MEDQLKKILCRCEDTCTCRAGRLRRHVSQYGERRSEHAYLSPSSFHKRIACAASGIREFVVEKREEFMKDFMLEYVSKGNLAKRSLLEAIYDEDVTARDDGSICHDVFEQCCLKRITDKDKIIGLMKDGGVSEAMMDDDFFQGYFVADIIRIIELLKEATWYATEVRVKLQGTGTYGTVDLVFELDNKIHVYDLKTGRLKVEVKGNEQLLAYGTGILDALGFYSYEEMEIGVIGVRFASSFAPYTTKSMLKFKDRVLMPRLYEAHSLNPEAIPGDHCLHCSAKMVCKEWLEKMEKAMTSKYFEPNFADLDDKQLTDKYMLAKQIEKFIATAKKEFCLRFESFNGLKDSRVQYVTPKMSLAYANEKEAIKVIEEEMGDDIDTVVTKKLKSPKDLKGVVSEEVLEKLIKTTSRKPYVKIS